MADVQVASEYVIPYISGEPDDHVGCPFPNHVDEVLS